MSMPHSRSPLVPDLRVAVTGGTSGLGLALVRSLFRRRRARRVRRARPRAGGARWPHANPGTHGIVGDVSSKDDIYPIALQILGELGGLDVLVNNASDLGPVPLRAARRHRVRGSRARARHERARAVSPDEGAARRARGVGARRRRRRRAERVERCRDQRLSDVGRVRRQQGGASPSQSRSGTTSSAAEGVRFLSIDPGDMDTPMHALGGARRGSRDAEAPAAAARELLDAIAAALRPSSMRRIVAVTDDRRADRPIQRHPTRSCSSSTRTGRFVTSRRVTFVDVLQPAIS